MKTTNDAGHGFAAVSIHLNAFLKSICVVFFFLSFVLFAKSVVVFVRFSFLILFASRFVHSVQFLLISFEILFAHFPSKQNIKSERARTSERTTRIFFSFPSSANEMRIVYVQYACTKCTRLFFYSLSLFAFFSFQFFFIVVRLLAVSFAPFHLSFVFVRCASNINFISSCSFSGFVIFFSRRSSSFVFQFCITIRFISLFLHQLFFSLRFDSPFTLLLLDSGDSLVTSDRLFIFSFSTDFFRSSSSFSSFLRLISCRFASLSSHHVVVAFISCHSHFYSAEFISCHFFTLSFFRSSFARRISNKNEIVCCVQILFLQFSFERTRKMQANFLSFVEIFFRFFFISGQFFVLDGSAHKMCTRK